MSKFARIFVFVLAGISFVLTACGAPAAPEVVTVVETQIVEVPVEQTGPIEGTILVDGSSTVAPIIAAVAEEFQTEYPAMMMLSNDGARSGTVIEFNETNKIFTIPKDKRTEDYVTGRFG